MSLAYTKYIFCRIGKFKAHLSFRNGLVRLVFLFMALVPVVAVDAELCVDAAFPGGNVVLDRVEGDTVYLKPDLRDTEGWWFYWNFKVSAVPAGRTLTFDFGNPSPLGVRGPAFSIDGGKHWSWLGAEACTGASFKYAFIKDTSAWFSFTVPYVESDLHAFLKQQSGSSHLAVERLCKTESGRGVERLRAGCLRGSPRFRVLLTARHHACETMASFVLEGLLECVLSEGDTGRWFQKNVAVHAVPFMDKDGVEQGDQGKNRRPRDHNRDYIGESIYPETAALRQYVETWSGSLLCVAIDFHCPYIRGDRNEHIYLVGSPNKDMWNRQTAFGKFLERTNDSPLPYRVNDNLPHGTGWNTDDNYKKGRSFALWAEGIPGVNLSASMEIPYANAGGAVVTAETARQFGASVAKAIQNYLESTCVVQANSQQ